MQRSTPCLRLCLQVRNVRGRLQALIYIDMGLLDEAYEKAQASLAMRQKVLSSEHPDLSHSLAGKLACCMALPWLLAMQLPHLVAAGTPAVQGVLLVRLERRVEPHPHVAALPAVQPH